MAKYHKATFKEGEISFYPNLGAIAAFEEVSEKSIAEIFQEGKTPKFSDLYLLLHEAHKVACIRKQESPVSLAELKAFLEGDEMLKIFNGMIDDLSTELGVGEQKKTK